MFVGSSWVDCVFKEKDKSPIKLYNKFGPQELFKERCFFVLSQAWDKEKIPSPYEESNLRPSDLCSDALPLSHKDSSVSRVSYEVLMTCILHTARISNVNSIMFFDRKVEMVSFELGEELRKMFFRLVTSVGQEKILSPHEESNLRPSDLHSDALPLSVAEQRSTNPKV